MPNIDNMCTMPPYINDEEAFTSLTYFELMHRMERVALSSVNWDGLPQEIKPMILERYLYYWGQCVFFYDDIAERYCVLPYATAYTWDVNYYPTSYDVIGFNGYIRKLDRSNSVIIWNNYQMTPTANMVRILATRLTNTLRTSDMHLEQLKIGKILSVPQEKQRGLKKILERIKNFHLYTITSPAGGSLTESTTVLDTEIESYLKDVDAHYNFLWHDALSYLGFDAMNAKASGVNILEAMSDSEMAEGNENAVINSREDAVKEINEMFDLNISVSFVKGVRDNGRLYRNAQDGNGIIDGTGDTGNIQSVE